MGGHISEHFQFPHSRVSARHQLILEGLGEVNSPRKWAKLPPRNLHVEGPSELVNRVGR